MKKLDKITQPIKSGLKPYHNEEGYILGMVMILSLMLALTVTIAIWSADNEAKLVRNTGENTQTFYDAETSLVVALTNISSWGINSALSDDPENGWMILSVNTAGEVAIWKTPDMTDPDSSIDRTNEIALLYVRPITTAPGTITDKDFDERAKLTPSMGSGGGASGMGIGFTTRIYSITAITTNSKSGSEEVIQIGIKQVFP